jgi:hypothetical protein
MTITTGVTELMPARMVNEFVYCGPAERASGNHSRRGIYFGRLSPCFIAA